MKLKNMFSALAGVALTMTLAGCDGEKDLVIIEGNLPIKTNTLYMVGDATPNGWSIDSPTPLVPTEEDPLVFTWEGSLNTGEMKLCLITGSFDTGFIRPIANGTEINSTPIVNAPFQMHAGDPDEKWKVTEAGVYQLTFDLRNWCMSTAYVGGQPAPEVEPIVADALYLVGDATANGWNIDAPVAAEKKSGFIFEYTGPLTAGEFKVCTSTGSWDVPFIRPASDGEKLSKTGFENEGFVYAASPDNKWKVADGGIYHLTFDLEHWTVKADFLEEIINEKNPIETATLFMIGDATPGGWSMDDATEFTVSSSNKYLFTWEGELVTGSMKACTERDGTFSCPFIRPSSAGVEINSNGVAASDFVYTTNPDDQWKITESGRYRITFDLENWTISATRIGGGDVPGPGGDEKEPLESATLYMIGDATPGGWSMDDATAFTRSADNKYLFTWEGNLSTGDMKACLQPDGTFSCPFLRPSSGNCEISRNGVAAPDFIYTTGPDDKWKVTEAGRYRLTFDLQNWTIAATPLD